MEKKSRKRRKLDLNIDTPKVDIHVTRDAENLNVDIITESGNSLITQLGNIARVILKKRG